MAKKFSNGIFTPKNPKKVLGKVPIEFRSSWEFKVMQFLDSKANVKHWASESIAIKYYDPVTKKYRNYIPDFLVEYVDAKGKTHVELVEVKPSSQALMENAKSKSDKFSVITNQAKWAAAEAYCKANGLTFRILTEDQIYITGKK